MPSALIPAMNNLTHTANGSLTHESSGTKVLDLFALGGAYRTRSVEDKTKLIQEALDEDPLLATKALFYLRDVRQGQGERELFRVGLPYVKDQICSYADNYMNLARLVAEYGRWDDILSLIFQPGSAKTWHANILPVVKVIQEQLLNDHEALLKGASASLLAKWMPSINASSKVTVGRAKVLAGLLQMKLATYRKLLSKLRKYLDVVERKMSAGEWEAIDFSHVPSAASLRYRKAFSKHQAERYVEFLAKVEKGEEKINAATLYPHEIVHRLNADRSADATLEALWKALPDYAGDQNALVVADTSGSMYGTPIEVSVSLAMYFAERNTGEFADHFITFSSRPKLQKVVGKTLREKVENLKNADWDMNTDLNAVFRLILARAKEKNVPTQDMPQTIYIISDMQFDSAVAGVTNYEDIKSQYAASSYELPKIVFWNVNATHDNMPVTIHDPNTVLVSGAAPATFKLVYESDSLDPEAFMLDILESKRYEAIDDLFRWPE